MAPKFGTSGLRGLVVELTPELVADHVRAFIHACPTGGTVHVGHDLRPSSPDIAEVVLGAIAAEGLKAVSCGAVPTPALALAAMGQGHAAIMITGSHIPADRNGLKFYVPSGEISKEDEAAIRAALGSECSRLTGAETSDEGILPAYVARYATAFGPDALGGLTIGVYQHSSVARDAMVEVVAALGGRAVPLGRSETFIPVDTEAVDPEVAVIIRDWCAEQGLDAVISTDGDADRPLVADHAGRIVPGDVLGALTAKALGARIICTPVSSNTMIDGMDVFEQVNRTRIGSPYVIAAMEAVLAEDRAAKVVGYEANGGFLLGFEAQGPAGPIAPLMTRDCLLPILAPLAEAGANGLRLAELVADLPPRFTAADRVQGIETERSLALIDALASDAALRADFFEVSGAEVALDLTDGLRVSFEGGQVVHLRPSGNAPECRCYAEAESREAALDLVATHLEKLRLRLGGEA